MAKETPAAPSKKVLEELADVQCEKSKLNRHARALDKREAQLVGELRPWVEAEFAANPKQTIIRRLSHWINVTLRAKTPKWKDEFIKVASAQRAGELVSEAAKTKTMSIKVEPIAESTERKAA